MVDVSLADSVMLDQMAYLWRELVFSYNDRPDRTMWWWERIGEAWSAPHRFATNVEHLSDVLNRIWELELPGEDMRIVEFATYLHHVVFDPRRDDNTEESINWAIKCLVDLRYPGRWIESVCRLIAATEHGVPYDRASSIMIDADRFLYSFSERTYSYHMMAVRKENAHLAHQDYKEWRAGELNKLLAQDEIYSTIAGGQHEKVARDNIKRELAALEMDLVTING